MPAKYEDRLLRVLRHIHDNPAGDLSLDALAEVAAMSRFHWHRVFHAMTGESCAEAVRRARMYRAAAALVQGDRPLRLIAGDVGYPSQQSFTRAFRAAYGLTPGAFRHRGVLVPPHCPASKGDHPMYPVETLDQPGRRLAALPHRGAYIRIGETFDAVAAIFSARGLWPHAHEMIGVYYDDPAAVAEGDLRSKAGIVIDEEVTLAAPLEEVRLPAGRYAVMHYKGPYPGLEAAYKYLYGDWLAGTDEEPGDHPPIEIYLNDPRNIAPEDLLTDVCVPLRAEVVA